MSSRSRNGAEYNTRNDDDFAGEIQQEIQQDIRQLDWKSQADLPVGEAATLIHEAGRVHDQNDQKGMHEVLAGMLAEVPGDQRPGVMARIPGELRERMLDEMSTGLRSVMDPALNGLAERDPAGHGEDQAERDRRTAQHQTQEPLEWDLERAQHALNYVNDICGEDVAHRLEAVITGSRNLEARVLPGYRPAYGNAGETHEKYVECIAGIPEAVESKHAMDPSGWSADQLQEAVEHEVNRMAYRLNLEIQDRLINQFRDRDRLAGIGRANGFEEEIVEQLSETGRDLAEYSKSCRHYESPTASIIETQAKICLAECGMVRAMKRGDHGAAEIFMDSLENREKFQEHEMFIRQYMGEKFTRVLDDAVETAGQWSDEVVAEGKQDYSLEHADLDFLYSNLAREEWLARTGQTDSRKLRTGDCITRALNEATGGEKYALIWRQVSQQSQTKHPEKDADTGVDQNLYRKVYEQHGMRELLKLDGNADDPLYKYLDLREIPALMEKLSGHVNQPLNYIGMGDKHAVAVVEGAIHDTWDSRAMGERMNQNNGRLKELWVDCDESTLNEVQEVLERYRDVLRHDQKLTLAPRWRESGAEMES